MPSRPLHRFKIDDRRYVIDTGTCFCFECDHISWDVLEYYPEEPVNRILHLLRDAHPRKELEEVVGELEWLRVTQAILTSPKDEELLELAAPSGGGLERITIVATPSNTPFEQVVNAAGQALFAASGATATLELTLAFREVHLPRLDGVAAVLQTLRLSAQAAGKTLIISVAAPLSSPLPDGHSARVQATFTPDADIALCLPRVLKILHGKPGRIADGLRRDDQVSRAVATAQPGTPRFEDLAKTLYDMGFRDIALDLPSAWTVIPDMSPETTANSLRKNADWYAGQLLRERPFRAAPFSALFRAVHEGKPMRRCDPSGVRLLAVDGAGRLFPSPVFIDNDALCMGNVLTGARCQEKLHTFKEFGALHMPACLRCWANGLCGGGYAAIHHARTGNIRTPDPVWCDSQRVYLAHAVAAFNQIADAGVNFTHMEAAMTPQGGKLSWLAAAKALFNMRLRARPLAEKDAEWLVRWENWNTAAYFTCSESGLLLATQYDREMDALHPRGNEQELVLTRMKGQPCGLIRFRASGVNGLAWVWLYLHDKRDYSDAGTRRTLRTLLDETRDKQLLRRFLVPTSTGEPELAACLEAVGCVHAGLQREALYLHGAYQDINIYLYG